MHEGPTDDPHLTEHPERLASEKSFNGFPVLAKGRLVGYVERERLLSALSG